MIWPVDPQRYALCLGVTGLFAITPGPAVLVCIAVGVARGRRAALWAMAGIDAASLVWFAGAALGIGALMSAAPLLFRALAWVGVIYLGWLGLQSLREGLAGVAAAPPLEPAPGLVAKTLRREPLPLAQGFLVQIANPKVLLFFTTVLPPFIDARRPVAPQVSLFALGLVGMDTLALTAYGLLGAALARRMREPAMVRRFAIGRGALLILAAALVGVERARS